MHRTRRTLPPPHGAIEIARGEPFTCRGSIFTAQAAWPVRTAAAARAALALMRQESHATVADANMSAFRIGGKSKRKIEKEYDDDGEAQLGQRLLGCLTKIGACDTAVMVSRVYGGENIGKRRFEITVERASTLLEALGHVPGEGICHGWGAGEVLGGDSNTSGSAGSSSSHGPPAASSSPPLANAGGSKKRKSSGASLSSAEAEAKRRKAQREAMAMAAEKRAQAATLE